jgi:hypothetical protein
MALVASTEMQRNYKFTYLPESNAVGRAGRFLRSSSEGELNDFVMSSVFWHRTCLFQRTYSKLYDLATLKSNWDSYGAPSPNQIAFDNALRILKFMKASDLEAMNVVPSAEGGIGLCFKRTDRYADIEALNDGTILGVRYVGMETPVLITVDGSDDSIRAGLDQIRNHISA